MRDVDLSVHVFDYDLTFAALLMNADGTIYSVYGGRDATSPTSHLSMPSFARALRGALADHERHRPDPAVKAPPRRTIMDLPPMRRRVAAGKQPECVHCHTVNDMATEDARDRGTWTIDQAWRWPDPIQVGLVLDAEDQARVARVVARSAAERAGIVAGDRLSRVGPLDVRTFSDVQRALHAAPNRAGKLGLALQDEDGVREAELDLPDDWKRPTPEVFAWRATKWRLAPQAGFGGKPLEADELEGLGLGRDAFAFRVTYLVTWGEEAHRGRNAAQAGVRKGDVVLSVDGETFRSIAHFHAWFPLARKVGDRVAIRLLRDGEERTVRMPLVE